MTLTNSPRVCLYDLVELSRKTSFDGSFHVSCYQKNSQDVTKIALDLSLVLNLMINSGPQDKWHILEL